MSEVRVATEETELARFLRETPFLLTFFLIFASRLAIVARQKVLASHLSSRLKHLGQYFETHVALWASQASSDLSTDFASDSLRRYVKSSEDQLRKSRRGKREERPSPVRRPLSRSSLQSCLHLTSESPVHTSSRRFIGTWNRTKDFAL